ncbi:membrane fusion protein [Duganella sp. 1411]|uniref:HlyD family secretion protein n=1 Tax=Duganella sp. 1411 TaxID=2806572 RepID=UPI001AE1EEF4|nr:HlyD family efflux transporter periplasmic adaptor subunit [Duganella sp. 1411]MBP1202365.1 membrane fusion protein [Duganella sp. 1411]
MMDAPERTPRHDEDALPLFRPELLQERQHQWLGTVLLKPRPMHAWFAASAALTVAAIVAALALGSYTSKARVAGWLVPAQGVVRVFAPRAGVATRVLVHEGETVARGQPLMALSTEEQSAALGPTQALVAHELAAQRDSLGLDSERSAQLFSQRRANLEGRLAAMAEEERKLAQEIGLQKSRLEMARQWEARAKELRLIGFALEQQVRAASQDAVEQAARVAALERSLIASARERATLDGELKEIPLRLAAQEETIKRGIAATSRELAETEARRSLSIPAPQAGTVTAIHASPGAAIRPDMSLLSIVPLGVPHEAHLYAPSRAVGFVRAGQAVLLRYRAYPYQKFGHYRGTVVSVSRSPIEPAELPAGFAAGGNRDANPGGAAEALYRIVVRLDRQEVTVYGKPMPLQPGMQLDADILLDRRRLYQWMLDPLRALSGNWKS